jgi:hypothetical protein
MVKMRWGVGMPWFEKLGLRALFNLKLFKAVLPKDLQALVQASP